MSGQPPDRNRSSSNQSNFNTPNHGRIRSRTIDTPTIPTSQLVRFPQGPTSPPRGHRAIPTATFGRDELPNDLQRFGGQSVIPFVRWAFLVFDGAGRERPNHNFLPEVDNAIFWSETIDAFDSDPRLIHELILRIVNPDLGHVAMEPIRQNRSMVEMLLYRHYQRHGGLILPPMAPAVEAMRTHETAVQQVREEYGRRTGRKLPDEMMPRIQFPNWRQATPSVSQNSGQGSVGFGSTPSRKGKGPSHEQMKGNPFGAPGDCRHPHGGASGAAGGGVQF